MPPQKWYLLTAEELKAFYKRIDAPERFRGVQSVASYSGIDQLRFLQDLHKHALIKVPFENLLQHYSWHGVVNVKPQHVFRKVTFQPGRGGYCMETNVLLHVVLLSLGFRSVLTLGRVWDAENHCWAGLTHLVPIVTIGAGRYLIDIAYGPHQPIEPIPLQSGTVKPQIPPAVSRLVFERPLHHLGEKEEWLYQYRREPNADWTTLYYFGSQEVLPDDVDGLNYSVWKDPRGLFTKTVVCLRFITDEQDLGIPTSPPKGTTERQCIVGTVTITGDKFTMRKHGHITNQIKFKSEAERIGHLQTYFGITLVQEDREAIFQMPSEIRDPPARR